MKFSEKKESDSEANVFLHNENLKWKISKMSAFELRSFRCGRFRIQNISNNHMLKKKYFPETQFLNSIFLRIQVAMKNSHLKKNVLTQFAPQKTTNFSLFVLILKGMILKLAFSWKMRIWNEILWKKRIRLWSKFFLENETLNWKFSNMSAFELRIYRPGRYRKQKFSNNLFFGENLFSRNSVFELNFYWEIRFRWKIHIWKKTFWLNLLSKKQQIFHFLCLF